MKKNMIFAVAAMASMIVGAIPASADDSLMRGPKAHLVLRLQDKATGAYMGEIRSLETGYGFNSDLNCRAFAVIDRKGDVTISAVGGCGTTVLGDVIRAVIPAGVSGYAEVKAAEALGDRQIAAAKATPATQIVNNNSNLAIAESTAINLNHIENSLTVKQWQRFEGCRMKVNYGNRRGVSHPGCKG